MLKPLHEFFCDRCGQVINSPDEGYVEWLDTGGKAHSFHIVHHAPASPFRQGQIGDCYHHTRHPDRHDLSLADFVGAKGIVQLFAMLDVGPIHDREERHLMRVRDVREFVEFARRLTIPHYEEARKYWSSANSDGFFYGGNEIWIYLPQTLKSLIERYCVD